MNLTKWGSATDTFDYQVLADNFEKIANHDHGANGGRAIDGTAITSNSVDGSKILDGSIDAGTKLKPGSITRTRIRSGIAPEVVTTLPSKNGLDSGYEVYYRTATVSNQSMSTALWHLRYNGTDKWEFVGGTPVSDYMETGTYYLAANRSGSSVDDNTPSYEQVTYLSNPLSVTVPPGYYHVTATARGSLTYTSAASILWLAVGSSPPTNDLLSASFAPSYTGGQTNFASTMTVVNNITTTSSTTEIKVWTDIYAGKTATESSTNLSNIRIGSITATPIYLNA
jgi:hypothetical protein